MTNHDSTLSHRRLVALYHAIADQIPATRLHDWLSRNAPQVEGVAPVPAAVIIPDGDGAQVGPGIVCEFCGGNSSKGKAMQDVELWIAELEAAGWRKILTTVWKSPSGHLFRGPYGAWCEMHRSKGMKVNS